MSTRFRIADSNPSQSSSDISSPVVVTHEESFCQSWRSQTQISGRPAAVGVKGLPEERCGM
jgi:hypothetical protein